MPVEYRTLAESQTHRDNPGSSCRSFDSIPHGQPSRPSSQQTLPNRTFPPPSGRRGKLEEIQGNRASVLSYEYQDLHDPFGDRKRVVEGKRGEERVDLGGRRTSKKK